MNAALDPAFLARRVRADFVAGLAPAFTAFAPAIEAHLAGLAEKVGSLRDMQRARDDWVLFRDKGSAWIEACAQAWNTRLEGASPRRTRPVLETLSLISDDEVENRILASRLSLALVDTVGWALRDLRLRLRELEPAHELAPDDVLHPDCVCGLLVDAWTGSGLTRGQWVPAQEVLTSILAERLNDAYGRASQDLADAGVEPSPDRTARQHLPGEVPGATAMGVAGRAEPLAAPETIRRSGLVGAGGGGGGEGGGDRGDAGRGGRGAASGGARRGGASVSVGSGSSQGSGPVGEGAGHGAGGAGGAREARRGAEAASSEPDSGPAWSRLAALTRAALRPADSPARVGLLGHLRAFLGARFPGDLTMAGRGVSPALARAIQDSEAVPLTDFDRAAPAQQADVRQVAGALRQRHRRLKAATDLPLERAMIEVVALMFQSILAEERIPALVRVWFARLQMPVLRVALAEPAFFEALEHPACRLIDRMGSCVMGFDPGTLHGSALEAEIRRIVQTIEQYPDDASRAFGVLLREFERFLASFLTRKEETRHLVHVAQQVEHMGAQVVRYTIEMRELLKSARVPEVVRDFLFKVWAEVLALADVRFGTSDPQTRAMRQVATDLLNAASPKPRRQERAQVIQELPDLLQRLRQGMGLLGMDARTQDEQVRRISATLADAFMSRTPVIPSADIQELAHRLSMVEVSAAMDDSSGPLHFELDVIRRHLGSTGYPIEIVLDAEDMAPAEAASAWLRGVDAGAWFVLDHNAQVRQVQSLWRSQYGHLHLFASADGSCFLFQSGRVAAYLQAALLVPADEEPLTQRAARQALAKLEANPERLLAG